MKRRHSLKLLSLFPVLAVFPALAKTEKSEAKKENKPAAKKPDNTKPDTKKAKAPKMLDENDTLAKAMQYRADASKAPAMRTNKKAFCYNCAKYNICMDGEASCKVLPKKDLTKAKAAPCQIFKGGNVAKEGWCLSWQAMS